MLVVFALFSSGIISTKAPSAQAQAAGFRVEVTGDRVNIRSQPSRNASVLLQVPRGVVLDADSTSGEWLRVKLPNGSAAQGWVHQDLVQRLNPVPIPTPISQLQATPTPVKTEEISLDAGSPPPLPFRDDGACPFEGCVYRDWVVRREIVVREEPETNSAVALTLQKGVVARAETGFVVTLESGEARATREVQISTRRALPGQTVYLLHYAGEGFYRVWFEGATSDVEVAQEGDSNSNAGLVMLKEPKVAWWVRIKTTEGTTGWTDQTDAFGKQDALSGDDETTLQNSSNANLD